ncbi:MAG: DUF4339 domain-containing protein [Granulosicoccus sp.]
MVTDEAQWYVQKGSRVQGPFSANEVGRFLLLGRVRNTDRVSRDGELWEPVTQVPELIPEELLNLQSDDGWNQFLQVRKSHDERSDTQVVTKERRANREPDPEQMRREWHGMQPQEPAHSILPWSLLGITLAALGVVLYLNAYSTLTG